jgi:hypothetical protein
LIESTGWWFLKIAPTQPTPKHYFYAHKYSIKRIIIFFKKMAVFLKNITVFKSKRRDVLKKRREIFGV